MDFDCFVLKVRPKLHLAPEFLKYLFSTLNIFKVFS